MASAHPRAIGARRPLARHLLRLAPELDAARAGDVAMAEAGLVDAAERERLTRHGHAHVHPHHARAGALHHVLGHRPVGGEDGGGVAVGRGRLQLQRRRQRGHADDGDQRTEQLPLGRLHVRADVVEDRGPQPVATGPGRALGLLAAPIHQHARALGLGAGDGRLQPLLARPVDEGPHAGPHLHRGRAARHLVDEGLHIAHGHEHAGGHAALARAPGERVHHRLRGEVRVRVRNDDEVVLRAAQGQHALAARRSLRVHAPGHRGRADEAHRLDIRVLQQPLHGLLAAVEQREDAGRKPRLEHQLAQGARGERHLLGGLEDEGVAHDERGGNHPQRHHGREVERGDARHHTQGLAPELARHPAAHFHGPARVQVLEREGEVTHLEPLEEPRAGLGHRLARLAGGKVGQPLQVLLQQGAEARQVRRALAQPDGLPAHGGLLRGLDDGGDPRGGSQRHAADHAPCVGTAHIERRGARGRDPLAAHEVTAENGTVGKLHEGHGNPPECALETGKVRILSGAHGETTTPPGAPLGRRLSANQPSGLSVFRSLRGYRPARAPAPAGNARRAARARSAPSAP
ncbi:hypothetical protein STIAU_2870 [Stigmatella aurantiaca DW4/3-1]|uniref:Uncharacterized protein n=1 Tax=Stigmatella aurantiaca (strain DW4/3-1) TaxID=378806 RepID=Q08Y71_STIAD|nr:hypothetical protein STIAU_2870 [Stigmatella aurantiaca DW4/3-1]